MYMNSYITLVYLLTIECVFFFIVFLRIFLFSNISCCVYFKCLFNTEIVFRVSYQAISSIIPFFGDSFGSPNSYRYVRRRQVCVHASIL